MKNKFCLESIATFQQINTSNTNHSPTKQTFSFSKSQRFQTINPTCLKSTYGGDNIRQKDSGVSIGNAKRYDFTQCLSVSPSSAKYKLKTSFEDNINTKRGPSIALGRQKITFNAYIAKQTLKVPSPNKYDNDRLVEMHRSPIFSIRKKTKLLDKSMTIESQNSNPGPGYYNNPEIDANSKYSSKFERISFSTSRSKRFDSSDNRTPGPGKYNEKGNLSAVGKYIVSQHQGGTIAKFDKTKRVSQFELCEKESSARPGPGYYQAPSEFGQYDGDVYKGSFRNGKIKKSE